MVDKEKIINLYNRQLAIVDDPSDPIVHFTSDITDKNTSKTMYEIISTIGPCSTILDIGCGTCTPLMRLPDDMLNRITYKGVDLNEKFIEINKLNWLAFDNMTFEVYDISDCNLKENYDMIFIYDTFAYFNEDEIIEMIDYYYTKVNRVLSFYIFTEGEKCPKELLIEQESYKKILKHIYRNYKDYIKLTMFEEEHCNYIEIRIFNSKFLDSLVLYYKEK